MVFRRELFSIGIGTSEFLEAHNDRSTSKNPSNIIAVGVGQRKSPFRIFHTTEAKTRPHDKRLVGYLCFYSKLDGWAEICMYELENRKVCVSKKPKPMKISLNLGP